MVYMIGGVTYGELATFRYLSSKFSTQKHSFIFSEGGCNSPIADFELKQLKIEFWPPSLHINSHKAATATAVKPLKSLLLGREMQAKMLPGHNKLHAPN